MFGRYECALMRSAGWMKNEAMRRLLAGFLVLVIALASQAKEASLVLPSGELLTYSRFPAAGKELVLWFASERGVAPAEIRAAQGLAARGTEVWQFDLAAAFFLPQTNSSMDAIPVSDVQAVLGAARKTGSEITIYAVNRAAVPVLRALADARGKRAKILLMHPHFYSSVDALVGAEYLEFGRLDSVDALVLQPRRSAATPWVGEQQAALARNGAKVQLRMLENVREGFWVRESATAYEISEGERLAERVAEWRSLLK